MKLAHLLISIAALALTACASSPNVNIDSDPTIKFSEYRTYSWLEQPKVGSPLLQQRLVDGVNARMQAKGLKLVPNGQIAIAANVASQQKQSLTTFYDTPAYAGWGWRGMGPGMGTATTTVDTYEVGTLVVDMFDVASKRAIWRGVATATIPDSQDKVTTLLEQSLDKMFAEYPPGTKPAKK
jgi:hypothetical protein